MVGSIIRYAPALVLSAAITATVSSTLQAQAGPQRLIRVGFGGGMTVPRAHAADALKNGMNGQGFVQVAVPGLPPIRIGANYNKFDWKEALVPGSSQLTSGTSEILGGAANITLNLLRGPVRPYLIAGLGAFNVEQVAETEGGQQKSSQLKFGIDGGAGIALRIWQIDAFIEGRIQNVYTEKGVIDEKSIQYIPVTFGIMF